MTRSLKNTARVLALSVFVLAALTSSANAQEAPQPLPPTASTLDGDLLARMDDARDLLQREDIMGVRLLVRMWRATDRFTLAQRDALAPAAVSMLRDAPGAGLLHLDAAWHIGGRQPDAIYAKRLIARAEEVDPEHAAYLLQRAIEVDPMSDEARSLHRSLTTDSTDTVASVFGIMIGVGASAGAVLMFRSIGLREGFATPEDLHRADRFRNAGLISFGAAAISGILTFIFWKALDNGVREAIGPDELPAFPE